MKDQEKGGKEGGGAEAVVEVCASADGDVPDLPEQVKILEQRPHRHTETSSTTTTDEF